LELVGRRALVQHLEQFKHLHFKNPVRGAILSLGYCIGLGAPFIASGLFFDRSENLRRFLVRRGDVITKVGGALLILIGLAQVFGLWGSVNNEMRSWISDFIPVV